MTSERRSTPSRATAKWSWKKLGSPAETAMTADMTKLLGAADELLMQIDGSSEFAADRKRAIRWAKALGSATDAVSRDLVRQVIHSIQRP